MFYYLHYFMDWYTPLRVLRYISFRAFLASGTAFLICLIIGPRLIAFLRWIKAGQPPRYANAPPLYKFHGKKSGTPTMGGLMIIAAVLVSTLLWAIPTNIYVLLTLGTMCFMGGVGFLDDYLKVSKKKSDGLGARWKLALQTLWVVVLVLTMWSIPATRELLSDLTVPFRKNPILVGMSLPVVLPYIWLVVVGASNAVNLTDGLDGLAIGCSNSAALAYLVMAYIAGHLYFADYLQVPYVAGSGELAVLCGSLLGAGLGFLWFNCHPARVFMGDTGSLALGGTIASVAICVNQEVSLLLVGSVFVVEALSVLLQVVYFKLSGGHRIFRCAPLHHHFELLEKESAEKEGRDVEVIETMITTRFWIISIICALIGVAALKLR